MRFKVTDADTATALGSGDVPVLATPRLIAWMEAVTLEAVAKLLRPEQTAVGTAIRIQHRRATPVGSSVEVIAELASPATERHLTFAVRAFDSSQALLAIGEIDRAVVDRERFLETASIQRAHG